VRGFSLFLFPSLRRCLLHIKLQIGRPPFTTNTATNPLPRGSTEAQHAPKPSKIRDAEVGLTTPDTPPTITINGDNPAIITVGNSYGDLGATVSDTSQVATTQATSTQHARSKLRLQTIRHLTQFLRRQLFRVKDPIGSVERCFSVVRHAFKRARVRVNLTRAESSRARATDAALMMALAARRELGGGVRQHPGSTTALRAVLLHACGPSKSYATRC
jgi:hypothetical protein